MSRLYQRPLLELVYQAQTVHRAHHPAERVQLATLMNVKSGGCPEDCAYCPQSARFSTGVEATPLADVDEIVAAARRARAEGASRFCMGGAYRSLPDGEPLERLLEAVAAVRDLGLEACLTMGMLRRDQAQRLKDAGLTAYNHNLDTGSSAYTEVISTRTYADRLETLGHLAAVGLSACCGGILGMGESHDDRIDLLHVLCTLDPHPESIPVNALVPVEGTPLGDRPPVDSLDVVRVVATARILVPTARIRLSAGRKDLSDSEQALCFLAGANSVFSGEKLLTTPNADAGGDRRLLKRLGLAPRRAGVCDGRRVNLAQVDRWAIDERERRFGTQLERSPLGVGDGIDLLSNDYLGLRTDPRVVAAAREWLEKEGLGSGGSRLLGGDREPHRRLEEQLAQWQGVEAGLLFASGSAANVGLLTALLQPGDLVLSDRSNHASLVDGIRLSGCRKVLFDHASPDQVAEVLARETAWDRAFVVVEGLHGMEGDRAPLADLAEVCRTTGALLIVDEAHAVGVVGPEGAGAVAASGCEDVTVARINPLGKALGGHGGLVTGSAALVTLLLHASRAFVFSTAPPPAVAAGVLRALQISRAEPWRRERAVRLSDLVRSRLVALGQQVGASDGAFVPWILGSPERALSAARLLRDRGFLVHAVRPPTVPEGSSRLRLSFHADLSDAEHARLLEALEEAIPA